MKQYIGTKLIEAEPAFRITDPDSEVWYTKNGDMLIHSASKREAGYQVKYQDGYTSWSPKEVFESAYLPMTINEELRTKAPSISQSMVDDFIVAREVITMGDKCTVVRAILRNGFEIVESSACVSAENYDEKLGAKICMEKIEDKVWFLLGFLLQTAVNGVNGIGNTGETELPAGDPTCSCEDCDCRSECAPCGMGFGEALYHLDRGRRVRRAGWNGNGIFIEMQKPDKFSKMTQPYIFIDTRELKTSNPAAPKGRVPWVASQTDMLATDWEVV